MIFQHFKNGFKELGKLKVFFMFMGPIKSLLKLQKHRTKIKLNPEFNHIYAHGHSYWSGAKNDGIDRGDQPYYCPVGWQRRSFYIPDKFYEKLSGWCISYYGTKFSHGLSTLLNGLKPGDKDVHSAGVYLTPSINYAAHLRHSEIKRIDSFAKKRFFKSGKYIQFVLECRVHPRNIAKIAEGALDTKCTTIDPNIDNAHIEWRVYNHNKSAADVNDPDYSVVYTGLLTRITDEHPGLLPELQWWYESHLCDNPHCCLLGMDFDSLQKQKQRGDTCNIMLD